MKRRQFVKTAGLTSAGLFIVPTFAQGKITAIAPQVGEDLYLYAVLDLLENSKNLEEFEKALNDEKSSVNNLDLNGDGEIDYIMVDEIIEDQTHLIVLKIELDENDFQDVATIEIEKNAEDDYVLQAVGAEELYGEEYIIEPETDAEKSGTTIIIVHSWPLIRVLFKPGYRRWRSPWRWHARPKYWRPWRPVARPVYRNRWIKSTRRARYRRTTVRRNTRALRLYKKQHSTAKRYRKTKKAEKSQQKSNLKKKQRGQKKD
jgi:hypothetical protein